MFRSNKNQSQPYSDKISPNTKVWDAILPFSQGCNVKPRKGAGQILMGGNLASSKDA